MSYYTALFSLRQKCSSKLLNCSHFAMINFFTLTKKQQPFYHCVILPSFMRAYTSIYPVLYDNENENEVAKRFFRLDFEFTKKFYFDKKAQGIIFTVHILPLKFWFDENIWPLFRTSTKEKATDPVDWKEQCEL